VSPAPVVVRKHFPLLVFVLQEEPRVRTFELLVNRLLRIANHEHVTTKTQGEKSYERVFSLIQVLCLVY
jgi:hypothetical protein